MMLNVELAFILLVFFRRIDGHMDHTEKAIPLTTTHFPFENELERSKYVCGEMKNSSAHQPLGLNVSVDFPSIELEWIRPTCIGKIHRYIVSVDQLPEVETTIKCSANICSYRLNAEQCNFCFFTNVTYTFRLTAIFHGVIIAPAAQVNSRVIIEACNQLPPVTNADMFCDGTSVLHSSAPTVGTSNSSAEITSVHWQTGAKCRIQCLPGFSQDYMAVSTHTCSSGRQWQPSVGNVACRLTVPVQQANLRYNLRYNIDSVDRLDYQFEGLIHKYRDIFCTAPDEECGIENLSHVPVLGEGKRSQVEVEMTLRPPLYQIEDQQLLLETVEHVLGSVINDNAFMALIDYQEIQLLLPQRNHLSQKISAQLCCHKCPPGYYYHLERCIQCTTDQCQEQHQ